MTYDPDPISPRDVLDEEEQRNLRAARRQWRPAFRVTADRERWDELGYGPSGAWDPYKEAGA